MLVSPSRFGGIDEIESGLRWDAATLAREVGRRAAELSRLGVARGSRIAIVHGGTANFFADLLAAWTVGAVAACLDPALTSIELTNIIAFTKPRVILVSGTSITAGAAPVVDLARAFSSAEAPASLPAEATDLALVLFTSGTTGTPKGVVLSFGALEARISCNISQIGEKALARSLVTLVALGTQANVSPERGFAGACAHRLGPALRRFVVRCGRLVALRNRELLWHDRDGELVRRGVLA